MILSKQLESSRIKESSSPQLETQLKTTANSNKATTRNLKILKSYYKKDALASVTSSFLSIDENYYNKSGAGQAANFKELSKLSIGALSIATTDSGASDTCSSFNSSCSNKFQKYAHLFLYKNWSF